MQGEDRLFKLLQSEGSILRPVKGTSMLPMLEQQRDIVKIVRVDGQLKKYDLPLYRRPNGEWVLHRIIAVRKDCYIICGDNCVYREKVPRDWVVGVAVGYYRDGVYTSLDDRQYLAYARRRVRSRPLRAIKAFCGRVLGKIKSIFR